jgi:hypothetical protein
MAKRGERRPWRLTTTWAHADIKPFTETFRTADEAISERVQRMRVDNVRGNSDSTFEITNRDNPGYQAPPVARCTRCFRWATEHASNSHIHRTLCAEHAEDAWAERDLQGS